MTTNIGKIIGGAVVVLVGISVVPTIAKEISKINNETNMTATAATITGLAPFVFGLGVLAVGIAIALTGLRQAEIMKHKEDNDEDEGRKPKKKNWIEQISSSSDRHKKKIKETPAFNGD
jgi:quinol-cytochrome oxidoreductase complex cytochrome b subunit